MDGFHTPPCPFILNCDFFLLTDSNRPPPSTHPPHLLTHFCSFLKALAGRLHNVPSLKVSGDIRYNGHTFDEFNVVRTAGHVEQIDNHIPQLTVLETLQFAQTCQTGLVAENYNFVSQIQAAILKKYGASAQGSNVLLETYPSERRKEGGAPAETDEGRFLKLLEEVKCVRGIQVMIALRTLGIAHTKDTPVGDATIR